VLLAPLLFAPSVKAQRARRRAERILPNSWQSDAITACFSKIEGWRRFALLNKARGLPLTGSALRI